MFLFHGAPPPTEINKKRVYPIFIKEQIEAEKKINQKNMGFPYVELLKHKKG